MHNGTGEQALALHGLRMGGIILAGALGLVMSGGESAQGQSAEPIDRLGSHGGGKLDGLGVSQENDAGLYLDDLIARQNSGLAAYSIGKADRNARLLPGLAGIAKQVVDALYRNSNASLAKDIFE